MNRVVLAAFALLLAGRGCLAEDQTTTTQERRLSETTVADDTPGDVTSAASRTGLGAVLLALLAFLYVGSAAGAALDESTTMADERRLDTTAADGTPDDVTSAAIRSGGLGTMLLALLAFLLVGNVAGAAVDESTTMADERRLDTTAADGDVTSRSVVRTAPAFALAAAFGLAARR